MQLFVKDKAFYKKVLAIAIPVTLQGLINMGVNMADVIMLGHLSQDALSASSLANQFCFIFMILNFGLGGGAGVLTGQFWGMGDRESIKKTLSIVYKISIVFALLFFAATQLFPESIMRLYTNEEPLIAEGARYLQIISWSFILQGISTTSFVVLRTVGVVKLTLVTSLVALVSNTFMNWMLIFGNLGAPQMGVAGAALATALSRVFEFIIIVVFVLFIDKKIQFKLRNIFGFDGQILKRFFQSGLPVVISDLVLALGLNVLTAIMGRIGGDFVAANAIASSVWHIVSVFLMGTSAASTVIIGNTIGAGKYEDAKKYGVTFLMLAAIIGVVTGCAIYLLRDVAVAVFGGTLTPSARLINQQLMSALAILAVFSSIQMMLTKGVLRAGGDTRFLMLADVLFLWVVSVPLGYTAGLVLRLIPFAVFLCLKIDEIIKAVWCIIRLFSGKWIRNVTIDPELAQQPQPVLADANETAE